MTIELKSKKPNYKIDNSYMTIDMKAKKPNYQSDKY